MVVEKPVQFAQQLVSGLPLVGAGEPVGVAVESLEHADAVIVVADGLPTGVLTRQDLLGYLAR